MALAAAVLAHDIGTPPFGHVMEYHLMESKGWNHEAIIRRILLGTHVPENKAHQFFGGRTINFVNTLRDTGISVGKVLDIVSNMHPMSQLLFGSLDLDNLDNVARMALFLGYQGCAGIALRIAERLEVNEQGRLVLPYEMLEDVEKWLRLRRAVYETMLFDPLTMASQAVLWDAIRIGFENGALTVDDAFLTDEQLLEELRQNPRTKDRIVLEYMGKPPNLAVCLQVQGSLRDLGLQTRREAQIAIEAVLRDVFKTDVVLGYVQVDEGTLEKRLEFDTDQGRPWAVGNKSSSVVLYGFVRQSVQHSLCKRASSLLLDRLSVTPDRVMRNRVLGNGEYAQPVFDFSPA
jgi:hypothetical protein